MPKPVIKKVPPLIPNTAIISANKIKIMGLKVVTPNKAFEQ